MKNSMLFILLLIGISTNGFCMEELKKEYKEVLTDLYNNLKKSKLINNQVNAAAIEKNAEALDKNFLMKTLRNLDGDTISEEQVGSSSTQCSNRYESIASNIEPKLKIYTLYNKINMVHGKQLLWELKQRNYINLAISAAIPVCIISVGLYIMSKYL